MSKEKEYYCVVMSEDLYEDGSNAEDPHQKYALDIMAESKAEAEKKAREHFEQQDKPVYWVEVYTK